MSQNKSRLFVQVPRLDASTADAVYRAVSRSVPGEHEDWWLSVYPYHFLEQEGIERLLVLEFASPQTLDKIYLEKYLNVQGEELVLLKSPYPRAKKGDSASTESKRPLSSPSVCYETKAIRDDNDLKTLEMILSPASGIKLSWISDRSELLVTFPHSSLESVEAELNQALLHLIEIREQNDSPRLEEDNEALTNGFKQELNVRQKRKVDNSNLAKAKVVEAVQCPICFDDIDATDSHKLPCGHAMHGECHSNFIKNHYYKCPQCQKVISKPNGNQPESGTMSVKKTSLKLQGHENDSTGTYAIEYIFPDGIQTERHPTPGARYFGTSRTAYLPISIEGKRVLQLLDKAFKARLTFTIGTSNTTGANNAVVWNNIHHKTNPSGGAYGYPDAGYLKRVTEELAAVGITDSD